MLPYLDGSMKPSHLLEDPTRWCKFTCGQKCDGAPCGVWSPGAVRWCLSAAMQRYSGLPLKQQEQRIIATPTFREWADSNAKDPWRQPHCIESFNDGIRHEDLMQCLREANL